MKKIFRAVWALWGFIFFVVTILTALLFMTPCFVLKEPAKTKWFHKVSKVWMTVFLGGVGCPVTVLGKEHFKAGQNYIVVCNHNSFFDIFAATPFLPNPNKSIAKASLAKIPVFAWVYGFGSVLVDRKNSNSRSSSFQQMKHVLDMGLDMVIYPEGTRNKTNNPLKEFYNGAFRLSADTGKPIIPVVIFNTRKILPAGEMFALSPHRIYLQILPQVDPQHKKAAELKEEVFNKMWKAYEANEKKFA